MISEGAKKVLAGLSFTERLLLDRNTPFKALRDDLVARLRQQGVGIKTIQEISGIPKSTISRIGIKKSDQNKTIASALLEINTKLDQLLKNHKT